MKFMSAGIPRTAVALAVSMLMASVAYAQTAEGSIYGRGKPGEKVTIENVESGGSRQITIDANGTFSAAKMQPGTYRVTSGGVTRDVTVAIGSGTAVSFVEDPNRVVVRGYRSAIDTSSVETNTVFSQEQIQALPVARDVNAVAFLAPGVVKGDPDLGGGGLPAFSGASVAENGYYINGFDVTNIRNFLSYANLPFDAIGAQQIKSGGYGAEYGRSLGGVVSLVTKRGTNEWKSGGAVYYEPSGLRSSRKNAPDLEGEGGSKYQVYRSANSNRRLNYNVYTGGPIIEDKLFMFALLEGQDNRADTIGSNSSTHATSNQPNGMIKLDFTPNDSHRLEFTGITNKRTTDYIDYDAPDGVLYTGEHTGPATRGFIKGGGHTLIGKYTGYLTDNFTLSALVGSVDEKLDKTFGARVSASACPAVYNVGATQALGCWNENAFTVRDASAPDDEDTRRAFRVDADWVVGDHNIRAGIDSQTFTSAQAGSSYSGGVYWRYYNSPAGTVNGVPNAVAPGGQFVRQRIYKSTSGEFEVKNEAYYIEDSWKITKDILLYAGLRSESFDNMNADGVSFVKADNLLAPRLGFSWDVKGDASMKVYGNAGRYYIPVASNTNIRATRSEFVRSTFHTFNGTDPVTAAPLNVGPALGTPQVIGGPELPDPATIADINLKPMSQDEYILGFQQSLAKGWTFGVRGISRKVQNGMDDYCSHIGFEKWAADNGYNNFDSHTMATCMMVNPGNDVTLMVDVANDGVLKEVTIPSKYLGLAKYSRAYNALEFTIERPSDGKWNASASYVLSKSKGTAEGYVNSIINQEDAGVSQDFDFASLTHGSDGYLSNDRRHVLKAYGNYMLTDSLRLGANATIASGRPISCIGFVPYTAADYNDAVGYSVASSFYCLNEKGVSELHNRGTFGRTPWTGSLDLSLAYVPKLAKGKLTLQLDVFNIFNQQQVTEVNEQRDYSRNTTTKEEGRLNKNWRQPTSFQEPRSVRMTARYEF